ncbi:hypothetical protein CC80DRAFT_488355 [Byssothecium circinans]|uniref:Uncharacterized protein n=1 Tax=Byssothecium circinans TaxID=147558 RepID=A0A6A5UE28_9PLEO|nr:hypothetical protein CC80DRAFT_488355 [Byssothecium circinans]
MLSPHVSRVKTRSIHPIDQPTNPSPPQKKTPSYPTTLQNRTHNPCKNTANSRICTSQQSKMAVSQYRIAFT